MSEPAFPVNELNQRSGNIYAQHFGLTMLDYFAAHAMQGLIAMGPDGYDGKPVVTAITAYAHAKEMMNERARHAVKPEGGA